MKTIQKIIIVAAIFATTITALAQSYTVHEPRSFLNTVVPVEVTNQAAINNMGITNGGQLIVWTNGAGSFKSNGLWVADVPLWLNRDGTTANAALNVVVGGSVGSTGAMTFVFQTVISSAAGTNIATTSAQNRIVLAVQPGGATDVTITTNLPTVTLQGAEGLRLISITSALATNAPLVRHLSLGGGTP